MIDLVKNSLLKVGDILAYKRNFTNVHRTVEKDALVRRLNMAHSPCLDSCDS